jgi:hypothetical protein
VTVDDVAIIAVHKLQWWKNREMCLPLHQPSDLKKDRHPRTHTHIFVEISGREKEGFEGTEGISSGLFKQTLSRRCVLVAVVVIDLVVASLAERVAKPFKTLVQTISARGASGLDVL